MTVDNNTHNTTASNKPRGRPSIDFTNMNILINNNTELSNDKPTLVYDLLCRDEPVSGLNLTDEQKKDKYLLVIATTLSQLTARGDKVWTWTQLATCIYFSHNYNIFHSRISEKHSLTFSFVAKKHTQTIQIF